MRGAASYRQALSAWARHYLVGLCRRAEERHLFLLSGGLAFSVLVCIVPLMLILFSVLGHVLDVADLETRLASAADTFIPYEGQARFVKEQLLARAAEIIAHRGAAGLVGTLGLLFAASGLFSSMRTILNAVFHTSAQRHRLVARARDSAMVLAVLCLFLVFVLAAPVVEALVDAARSTALPGRVRLTALQGYLYSAATWASLFAALWALYYFVPYERLRPRVAALSAVWATAMWQVAAEAFGLYIARFGGVGRVYGTYALVAVGVLWVYCAAVIFIVGAEVGQLYRERLEGTAPGVQG